MKIEQKKTGKHSVGKLSQHGHKGDGEAAGNCHDNVFFEMFCCFYFFFVLLVTVRWRAGHRSAVLSIFICIKNVKQ